MNEQKTRYFKHNIDGSVQEIWVPMYLNYYQAKELIETIIGQPPNKFLQESIGEKEYHPHKEEHPDWTEKQINFSKELWKDFMDWFWGNGRWYDEFTGYNISSDSDSVNGAFHKNLKFFEDSLELYFEDVKEKRWRDGNKK